MCTVSFISDLFGPEGSDDQCTLELLQQVPRLDEMHPVTWPELFLFKN